MMNRVPNTITVVFFILLSTFSLHAVQPEPLHGTWDFKPEKIWETDSAGDDLLAAIWEIAVGPDGRLYVFDSKHFKIFILNADGSYFSSFGDRGEGPGQLKNIGRARHFFLIDKWVVSFQQRRLHYFTLDGRYSKTVHIPKGIIARAMISPHQFISSPLSYHADASGNAEIVRYDLKKNSKKVVARFKPYNQTWKVQDNGYPVTMKLELIETTPMMIVAYRNGRIYYGKSDTYRIECVDLKGNPVRSYTMKRPKKKVTVKYHKELEESFRELPPHEIKEIIDAVPGEFTYFTHFEVDADGLLYVLVTDPEDTSSQVMDVFSPSGRYIYKAEIKIEPEAKLKKLFFRDNLLIMTKEDENGDLTLAKYSVTLPPLPRTKPKRTTKTETKIELNK